MPDAADVAECVVHINDYRWATLEMEHRAWHPVAASRQQDSGPSDRFNWLAAKLEWLAM